MIVPISQEISVAASFFSSHSRQRGLRLSAVSCVSSQINGVWRGAGAGCFPQRFTELISAAVSCQHIRYVAISPEAVLYLSLSILSLSLSRFVRGREGGDEQIHTTRLVAVKPRRSMSELFLIHYIHVNFSPLTQKQNQTTANDRRLSVLQKKLSHFIVELQLTDRKSKNRSNQIILYAKRLNDVTFHQKLTLMVRFLRGLEDNYIVSEDRKTSRE